MTLEEAQALVIGSTVYHVTNRNADGSPQRWKVTSIKTWKRSPERIRLGLKYGLRGYDSATEAELHLLEPTEERALATG